MTAINPYLTFDGNCEEAFNFYKSVFGGDFPYIGRYSDMPSDAPKNESESNKIMHVSLPIGEGTILMGSDQPQEFGKVIPGNNFAISINAMSEQEATRLFNALSEGGKVTMPMNKTFWGAFFGMFTDKFGINWMVNYDYNQEKKY
jgi:PhnB protein